MRILSVVRKNYYGVSTAREPMSFSFTIPLREMGHDVETFDHFEARRAYGKQGATERLIEKIRSGNFDVVFYQTSGDEPVDTSGLADLARQTCLVAWNSDDDWQWETTRRLAGHFTYMVTTYPHIYEQDSAAYPNLLLSQWACLGCFSDFERKKDIDFSFAGAIYGARNFACHYLQGSAALECFGRGARLLRLGLPYFRGVFRLSWLAGAALRYEEINEIWNRSRISYTPMSGGPNGAVLSLKGRAFEMGLSGTLMLCEHSPNLERYYVPGQECITFDALEDCAEKARWYLAHETERARIVRNYRNRTVAEHLWTHRFADLFSQIGLVDERTRTKREPNIHVDRGPSARIAGNILS